MSEQATDTQPLNPPSPEGQTTKITVSDMTTNQEVERSGTTADQSNSLSNMSAQIQQTGEKDDLTVAEKLEVPDKFKNKDGTVNQEALLKSYRELEKSFHTKAKVTTDEPSEPDTEAPTQSQQKEVEDASSFVASRGLDYAQLQQEFAANGTLTDEQYEQLGVPKAMVDDYIASKTKLQETEVAQRLSTIKQMAGGEESYNKMLEWGNTNLSQEDKEAFDAILESGSNSQIRLAIQGLHAQYRESNPEGPKQQIAGKPTGSSSTTNGPFGSREEMLEAMKDPRYMKIGGAYRNQVLARVDISRFN